ncbi:hypothetical protein [Nocardia sp. NPDC048505]|uniref:ATP-dependent DNA ligase n=1 Tax=unclassified Nocardia TaxID=2637762 RepID=UPI0034022E56
MTVLPAPMHAVAGRPPDNPAWAIELQWDGVRVLAACDGVRCRLVGADRREVTGSYPEVAAAVVAVARKRALILDGVIRAETPSAAKSLRSLPRHPRESRPTARLCAFDLLAIEERDLTSSPYLVRRHRLEGLGRGHALVSVAPSWRGIEAAQLLHAAAEHNARGIVSKEIESAYHAGRCSPAWIATSIHAGALPPEPVKA